VVSHLGLVLPSQKNKPPTAGKTVAPSAIPQGRYRVRRSAHRSHLRAHGPDVGNGCCQRASVARPGALWCRRDHAACARHGRKPRSLRPARYRPGPIRLSPGETGRADGAANAPDVSSGLRALLGQQERRAQPGTKAVASTPRRLAGHHGQGLH
jgi:hypothetical protein